MKKIPWRRIAACWMVLLCWLMVSGMTAVSPMTISVAAVGTTQGDFVYAVSDDGKTAVVMAYKGKGGKVKVPDQLGGKPVSAISSGAFQKNDSVTAVTLPKTVTAIADNAFQSCSELISIELPDGLTTIGERAFWYCTKLSAVTLPKSLRVIGYYAFFGCVSLKEATIPEGVETIGSFAFSGCSNLSSVTVPDSVRIVGSGAFGNTAWYDGCSYGDVIIRRCYYKYKGTMPSQHTVTMDEEITVVADGAFAECDNLTGVTLPTGLKRLGSSLFYQCRHLADIVIPSQVTVIADNAFFGCSALKSVTIPDLVTEIGKTALSECVTLTRVVLPHSLQRIGEDAFVGCYQLSDVIYIGTKEDFTRIEMDDKTRELLLSKLNFVSSSEAIPGGNGGSGGSGGNPLSSNSSNSLARPRGTVSAVEAENRIWMIVIIVGAAFIFVMALAFIVRAIVSRRKQSAPVPSAVSVQPQMPRWRNAPSVTTDRSSSDTTEDPSSAERDKVNEPSAADTETGDTASPSGGNAETNDAAAPSAVKSDDTLSADAADKLSLAKDEET